MSVLMTFRAKQRSVSRRYVKRSSSGNWLSSQNQEPVQSRRKIGNVKLADHENNRPNYLWKSARFTNLDVEKHPRHKSHSRRFNAQVPTVSTKYNLQISITSFWFLLELQLTKKTKSTKVRVFLTLSISTTELRFQPCLND